MTEFRHAGVRVQRWRDRVPKPLTERELIEMQIKTYDFYARLIDRAIGGSTAAKLPKWDEERTREYQQLADNCGSGSRSLTSARRTPRPVTPTR